LVSRDFFGDADGGAVDIFDAVFEADCRQLVAAGVEGEGLEDFGSRFAEFDVEFAEGVGVDDGDFGCEGTRTDPSAFFEFE
jgi:hypothetical protein